MANFKPFNNYTFFLVDKLLDKHNINPPFLDAGCGIGDLSYHLGSKKFDGKAIDLSKKAYTIAKNKLQKFPKIKVERTDLEKVGGKYNCIFLWDVMEHIENDIKSLKIIRHLLNKNGYLLLHVPSNMNEWNWDDEFYGHYRRYGKTDLKEKLNSNGFKIVSLWDTTFPFFWLMRGTYLSILKKPKINYENKNERTSKSSLVPSWKVRFINNRFFNITLLWMPIYIVQYFLFKNFVDKGFSLIVVAKKINRRK